MFVNYFKLTNLFNSQACSNEIIMLRAARRYDAATDAIVFGNNFPYTREAYKLAGDNQQLPLHTRSLQTGR